MDCPKCQNEMRSYERNGVVVDQCSGCRGVFLDRGELERLVDAEGGYYEQRGFKPEKHFQQQHHHDPRKHYGKKKRKESFLSDLLDF
jgi:uncharacterized protein